MAPVRRHHEVYRRSRQQGKDWAHWSVRSWSQFPGSEVVLRRNTECVSDAIEKGEQGCDVYCLGDLFFLPAGDSQFLDIFGSRSISRARDQFHILQQRTFRSCKACFVELAFDDCRHTLIGSSLNTQEVSVAVQSIRAPVQVRDVAGDHLFVAARKMPFREMDRVSQLDDAAQEVRSSSEALD